MTEAGRDGHIGRIQRLADKQERQKLLQEILEQGWEIGCWLRPESAHLVFGGSEEHGEIFELVADRVFTGAVPGGDPFPEGLPQSPIKGSEPCWIVVTQQCDLLRDFREEPFAELARASLWTPSGDPPETTGDEKTDRKLAKRWQGELKQLADQVRSQWLSSARHGPLAPGSPDGQHWVVDLRHRVHMPKDLLPSYTPTQALPRNDEPYFCRDRFRRRLGDRYARAAVPDAYLPVVAWLKAACKDGPGNTMVREWVLRPPDAFHLAELHAIGLAQSALDVAGFDGERWASELSDEMPADVRALIDGEIRWAPADVFPVATWDGAWRLDDLEALSWRDPIENPLPPR